MSKKKKRRDLISFTSLTGTKPEELKTTEKEIKIVDEKKPEPSKENEQENIKKESATAKETVKDTDGKKEDVPREVNKEDQIEGKKEPEENQNNGERGANMSLESVIEKTYSSIIEEKKKRDKKELRGIYFDSDVAEALDKIGKQGGRGAKSEYVNSLIRAIMVKQGLLKE